MKKGRIILILLSALLLVGCDNKDNSTNQEDAFDSSLLPSECNVDDNAAVQENMETYLAHQSEWHPYKDI